MNTHGQSLLFEYPLFRRNFFSELYHILLDCFKPYKYLTSFTEYMLRFAFVFDTELPSRTFIYMSESNDSYKYAVTTSINYKDRCFCIARDIKYQNIIPLITREYVSLKSTLSLHKTLCNQPHFISYNLIIFVSLSNKNPLEPNRKGSGRCRYHFCEHLFFVKGVKLSFNCFFPLILIQVFLTLCHVLRIWIVKEIFSNNSSET
jgi:hypothetical protein